jgi:ribosomal-protein-alanine acetyltransferase
MIRSATLDDLDALVRLEQKCFDTDRLSRRSFRYMLTQAKADLQVATEAGQLLGYALVLHHRGTPLARLYSIAVSATARGRGIGNALLDAVETLAVERGCHSLRLEVGTSNKPAIQLYTARGYREIARLFDYYENHGDALRMEKSLLDRLPTPHTDVPFYAQSTEFTCGPAALLMAMTSLDSSVHPDRREELRIWRESTSIFMTSGHGGCGPLGLALAAHRRDFDVRIAVSRDGPLFLNTVRSELKKEVMRVVHADFTDAVAAAGIPVRHDAPGIGELREAMQQGYRIIILVSSSRLYQERFPHWLVITGIDDRFVYAHDPYIDTDTHKTATDSINIPLRHDVFTAMTKHGKKTARAMLMLKYRGTGK